MLIKQLQKAIDKYGDMNVGAYDRSYALDVEKERDTNSIKFRVLNGSSGDLPGESMDIEEEQKPSSGTSFGVIFYDDTLENEMED
jgi:hypothetical protein